MEVLEHHINMEKQGKSMKQIEQAPDQFLEIIHLDNGTQLEIRDDYIDNSFNDVIKSQTKT